jgi:C-terminal processing protease CtpA/Prc
VENHGVQPDYEIEFDPQAWRQGHDPQLEKAVELVMAELKKNPPPFPSGRPTRTTQNTRASATSPSRTPAKVNGVSRHKRGRFAQLEQSRSRSF